MSGHSKWETIKRAKGANDAKRGATFTRLGNQIAIAARSGTDPSLNFALRLAIDTAKAANMPMSTIDRAIQRVSDKSATQLEEVTYEGYGQAGVAILVEAATDNRNRTYPEIKSTFTKNGGAVAEPGSVMYQFSRKGLIIVKASGDDALMQVLDAGAEDASEVDGELHVYTDPKDFTHVQDKIRAAGLEIIEAKLTYEPNGLIEVPDTETAAKVMKLINALDDLDDTIAVHTNFDIKE